MELSKKHIHDFANYLCQEEKSAATQEKYLRDARSFFLFAYKKTITKELVIAWKKSLAEQGYATRSINSMLASVNSLLAFLDLSGCKVKSIRTQRQTYCAEEKELTKAEYLRLLEASKENEQLNLVIKTICGTGIRVSELKHFTVEAIVQGEVTVNCKNKTRQVFLPGKLKKILLNYAKQRRITTGPVFITRTGRPLDRSNILVCHEKTMRICGGEAGQSLSPQPSKTLCPHILRDRKRHCETG